MIRTLQNTIKQDKECFAVPKSVQDTIPIQRLWPDGVFQFGSKYSRTLRFSDINYAIASKEDKTAMFLSYSELLNALDTGSTTKLTINNKRVDRENVARDILLPRRDDFLDGYRAEYNRQQRGAGAVSHPLRPPQERGGGPRLFRPGRPRCLRPPPPPGLPLRGAGRRGAAANPP